MVKWDGSKLIGCEFESPLVGPFSHAPFICINAIKIVRKENQPVCCNSANERGDFGDGRLIKSQLII